eukprot:5786427-Prymnesium_polylepis.1
MTKRNAGAATRHLSRVGRRVTQHATRPPRAAQQPVRGVTASPRCRLKSLTVRSWSIAANGSANASYSTRPVPETHHCLTGHAPRPGT